MSHRPSQVIRLGSRFATAVPMNSDMQVAQSGDVYLGRRERQLWVGLVGVGLAVVTLVLLLGDVRASVAVLLAGILVGTKLAVRLRRIRSGRLGERSVTHLLSRLPDDYYLLNNVVLGDAGGDVDHVLVGPCGVVVLETKRLAGLIRCRGDSWYVNGYPRRSVSKQVNGGAVRVKDYLRQQHPDLPPSALRFVKSIVVFTHPLCRLRVDWPKTTVVRFSELLAVVIELGRQCQMPPALAARLVQTLASSQSLAKQARRPGS